MTHHATDDQELNELLLGYSKKGPQYLTGNMIQKFFKIMLKDCINNAVPKLSC